VRGFSSVPRWSFGGRCGNRDGKMARYEHVVFFDIGSEEADELLELINNGDEDAAIEYMAQWHNYGEHETRDIPARGTDDDWYDAEDGYILSWNNRLGYVGLEFDTDVIEDM
jgi:hypothetical protein